MRKLPLKPYLTVIIALSLLVALPLQTGERLRVYTVASLSPLWNRIATATINRQIGADHSTKESLSKDNRRPITAREKIEQLELENYLLKGEVSRMSDLLLQEALVSTVIGKPDLDKQRRRDISTLQQLYLHSLPGRVIFRSPDSWNSTFWINVGEIDNEKIGHLVVAKNSPVVIGTTLVGVIDKVNKRQSRVKLITDASLNPSVRAYRAGIQRNVLADHLDALILGLSQQKDLLNPPERRLQIEATLSELKSQLGAAPANLVLAKGELQGSSTPLWRGPGTILHGTGFNLDFTDIDGPARDLRTGIPLDGSKDNTVPILMVHDILVTTGMDGVFPAGLKVAEVTSIDTLFEGDYFYELEGRPLVGGIQTLTLVSVLPPLGFIIEPD